MLVDVIANGHVEHIVSECQLHPVDKAEIEPLPAKGPSREVDGAPIDVGSDHLPKMVR